jgi:hypothetical protein
MDDITATDCLVSTFQLGGLRAPRDVVSNYADLPLLGRRPCQLVTAAPLAPEMADSLEPCVCGHPSHPGRECNGGCGCTTFEPDEGRGWVRVNYIFKATSIHPQGPYPFGKAS